MRTPGPMQTHDPIETFGPSFGKIIECALALRGRLNVR